MANSKLSRMPETEQALLYAKLNEYNWGRMSYKETGTYFVVLLRPGHPIYSVQACSPSLEKSKLLFIHEPSADINKSLRMVSTLFSFSKCCLLIVEYNERRIQSNGDGTISFDRYHGHHLHEILKIGPAYLGWIAYKYTLKIPKQERFIAIARVYHSAHLDIIQRRAHQKRETSRFLGNEGEKLESLNLKVAEVQLEDDPYKTRVVGSAVRFFVQQTVTLADPSRNLVVMKISSKTPSPVSCQLPALEHEFRPGEIVHIVSARVACTYESYSSRYTRLNHVKFRQVS